MNTERHTQDRIIRLFQEELGYRYLGNWSDREDNSNIELEILHENLVKRGYGAALIGPALRRLTGESSRHGQGLYATNKVVYELLRFGVPVKTADNKVTETVHLIDWVDLGANDFAIAEEVTLEGPGTRRPDLVLYVNGIAIGVIELKNGRKSMAEGIRQVRSLQQKGFHEWFFTTVQFVFAGNDTEGLRYGTIETDEKFFLQWKEDEADNTGYKLDKYLAKMCNKARLLELMHDFVLFDGGRKKLPRVHQYFGIKAAQAHVRRREGGIIWHTQGAGKSILMVLLAKWILENLPHARVAIVTDREELDAQIEGVFQDAGETIYRTRSGRDLMAQLGQATPRLLCSLVHKFGRKGEADFEGFIAELESQPSKTVGDVYVFVDECHRTQSGKLNRVMKALLPDAVFIGFTGTPLLKKDKQTSMEVFGGYIHTYKFSEAVEDHVVLDLLYEARDVDQRLTSTEKVDAWFEAKTRGLNDWRKEELKKQWGTMQAVLSSRSRMERVVGDIVFDFSTKSRLSNDRGNALLVAASIHDACRYYTLFQKTDLKGKCAIVTSYNPQQRDITLEDTGATSETDKEFIYHTYTELLKDVTADAGKTKTEAYEIEAKRQFVREPARMKLLIVVDKLLTGFDAPPCTYLYIDKSMQDHGLFQAICRTNRLDGDDKDFGHVVDYKDLFTKLENAIAVYSSELDHSAGGATPEILLQDRLKMGRQRLEEALERLGLLCEGVAPSRTDLDYIHFFCGNTEVASDLAEREPFREELYRGVALLMRAYGNIVDELERAGYTPAEIALLKRDKEEYARLRELIKHAAGETLDLKAYEADMRHLLDTYIQADEPRKISPFDDLPLLDLIVKTGIADAIALRMNRYSHNRDAVAETIENNVRSKIIRDQLTDPEFYNLMSALLDEIIAARKAKAIEYAEYLKRVAALVKKVAKGQADDVPELLDTPGKRALYNSLGHNLGLALAVDAAVKEGRPDAWRGEKSKELVIKRLLLPLLGTKAEVERIFLILFPHREY